MDTGQAKKRAIDFIERHKMVIDREIFKYQKFQFFHLLLHKARTILADRLKKVT